MAYTYGTQSTSCPDGALNKPHAVVTAGSNTFCYDRNGNMVKRNSGAYTLAYDAENRLTGVSGSATGDFVYGPGGERVKGTVNGGTTTLYIGAHYEKQGTTIRKYYYAGGTRVALRENGTLSFLLADHLGSQAITANASGAKAGEVRYKAFGADRYTWGTTPTTYRYTGQRQESAIGLYYYGARWYDGVLGRFIQPDTVIPGAGNPQNLNRFSYTLNNPLRYTDPTGHAFTASYTADADDPIQKTPQGGGSTFWGDSPDGYWSQRSGNEQMVTYSNMQVRSLGGNIGANMAYANGSLDLVTAIKQGPAGGPQCEVQLFGTLPEVSGKARQWLERNMPAQSRGETPQLGVGYSKGMVYGEAASTQGTDAFGGEFFVGSVSMFLPPVPVLSGSGTAFMAADPNTGAPSTSVWGVDLGVGIGMPAASAGIIATYSTSILKYTVPLGADNGLCTPGGGLP